MDFRGMTSLFQSYTGAEGDVDNVQLAQWFNEAQLDLTYDFAKAQQVQLTEADHELPSDLLRIIECSSDYEVLPDGEIVLSSLPATLYYTAMPVAFTGADLTQESELPEAVHYLMAIFAASRYWDLESEGDQEESGHATKWMNYYLRGKAMALSKLNTLGVRIDRWRIE